MKTNFKTVSLFGVIAVMLSTMLFSCKKDERMPPDMVFKTTAGYTHASGTASKMDTLMVGIRATKTEDELKTFNVSYAYDGATTTTNFYNYTLVTAEENSYSKDINIVTRNLAGTEKWIFTMTDRDGNIKSLDFTLTVN